MQFVVWLLAHGAFPLQRAITKDPDPGARSLLGPWSDQCDYRIIRLIRYARLDAGSLGMRASHEDARMTCVPLETASI
jgi:hypothetical protein